LRRAIFLKHADREGMLPFSERPVVTPDTPCLVILRVTAEWPAQHGFLPLPAVDPNFSPAHAPRPGKGDPADRDELLPGFLVDGYHVCGDGVDNRRRLDDGVF